MFIFCKKVEVKEAFLKAGFRLITAQEQKGSETVWVFEFNPLTPIPNFEDKDAFFMSKKMSF